MAVHDPAQSKLSNVLGKSCGLTTVDMNQDKMHAACSHSPWKTPTATLSPRQQMHWRRPNRNRIAPQSELGWSTPNSPTGVHCTQASYGVMTAKLWWMVRIPWYPWIVSIILHHSHNSSHVPQAAPCHHSWSRRQSMSPRSNSLRQMGGDDMWSGVHLQGTFDYSPQQGVVGFIEVVLLNYDIWTLRISPPNISFGCLIALLA